MDRLNANDEYLKKTNKTKNEILRRIHIKNKGKILIGVNAFIFIWSKNHNTKYFPNC